jgi:hypothetical protein
LLCCATTLWALSALAASAWAAAADGGTSSREAQRDALAAIPFDRLDDDAQRKVQAVLSKVSIFRRMPTQVVRCDPRLYQFVVSHPEVIVNIWDVLGMSKVSLLRTGERTFRADDGAGTRSDIQVLYAAPELHLLYCVGTYEGMLFTGAVRGGALLLLRTGYFQESDGEHYVTCRLDAFIRIDHAGVELVGRTFQPLVGRAADSNFSESVAFVSQLSHVAQTRPETLQRLAGRLTKVRPEDRQRFAELVAAIAQQDAETTSQVHPAASAATPAASSSAWEAAAAAAHDELPSPSKPLRFRR